MQNAVLKLYEWLYKYLAAFQLNQTITEGAQIFIVNILADLVACQPQINFPNAGNAALAAHVIPQAFQLRR